MSHKDSRRDAAMKAFHDREGETARASTERRRLEEEHAAQHQANFEAWSSATNAILLGVKEASDDFARRGSPFLIHNVPVGRSDQVAFEVHRSGSLRREAALVFSLHQNGVVQVETDARGAKMPEGVAVGAVTAQWAEDAAEQLIAAFLHGRASVCT